jgi:hypothetical protein
MASLYERLMGVHATRPKIPVHQFQALASEWARTQITGAQANVGITSISGIGLDSTEVTEAQDLLATVPTGPGSEAARALRMLEIDQILLLADLRVPPYDNPDTVRTRFGVPTRP